MSETAKDDKARRNPKKSKDPKMTSAEKSDNTAGRNKSKDVGKRREIQKIPSSNRNKAGDSKITKENSTNKLVVRVNGQINSQMQKRQNNFRVKYGYGKTIIEMLNDLKK